LASLAKAAHDAAESGNVVIQEQIKFGASVLVASVGSAKQRLNFENEFPVAGVGGMFRASLVEKYFADSLQKAIPEAVFTQPRFNPAIGALLLAYKQAKIEIDETLLANLEKRPDK
jgi:activator of 2-hydroxyglutaryl-CoA dehydratase